MATETDKLTCGECEHYCGFKHVAKGVCVVDMPMWASEDNCRQLPDADASTCPCFRKASDE